MSKLSNDNQEMVNQIYDTLMENVGMSEFHTAFPIDNIDYSEVNAQTGEMYFRVNDHAFTLTFKEVEVR